jgi:hypothetical protein
MTQQQTTRKKERDRIKGNENGDRKKGKKKLSEKEKHSRLSRPPPFTPLSYLRMQNIIKI